MALMTRNYAYKTPVMKTITDLTMGYHLWNDGWLESPLSKSVPVKSIEPFVLLDILKSVDAIAQPLRRVVPVNNNIKM